MFRIGKSIQAEMSHWLQGVGKLGENWNGGAVANEYGFWEKGYENVVVWMVVTII